MDIATKNKSKGLANLEYRYELHKKNSYNPMSYDMFIKSFGGWDDINIHNKGKRA